MTKRTHRICKCTPVGTKDIAALYGLKAQTIALYKMQGLLPPVRWTVSGYPAWCLEEDIEPWANSRRFYQKSEVG